MTDPQPNSSEDGSLRKAESARDLVSLLSQKVVGQSAATKAIVPYIHMYQSGLAPEGRPAGVFLLLGPTGTGKTKTVEAIAELLHGSEKKIVESRAANNAIPSAMINARVSTSCGFEL